MRDLITITAVESLDGLWIRATFSNGAVKEIDLSGLLSGGGVLAPIHDNRDLFEQVRVNPESGTIEWPGEIDLDPEVLYGLFEPVHPVPIERRTLREPVHAPA